MPAPSVSVGETVLCHDGGAVKTAIVAGVYPDQSIDLSIVQASTGGGSHIVGGISKPKFATSAADKLVDGTWWKA
jgi:hypothetical protein